MDSSSLAAAHSWLVAELVWVTWDTWLIAWSICVTAVAWSLDATAMLWVSSTTCSILCMISDREPLVSCASLEPRPTLWIESSIISAVSLAAEALFPARFRTSSATTAKPFPWMPALAASTAAFSARMLVWKAISSMTLIILEIFSEASLMSVIAPIISDMLSLMVMASFPIFSTKSFASLICSTFTFVRSAISFMDAVISSVALACWVAP